jgi:hypothetical protein
MSLKNPVTPPGIDPGTVRLVAQRLNHYATPGPKLAVNRTVNIIKSEGNDSRKEQIAVTFTCAAAQD